DLETEAEDLDAGLAHLDPEQGVAAAPALLSPKGTEMLAVERQRRHLLPVAFFAAADHSERGGREIQHHLLMVDEIAEALAGRDAHRAVELHERLPVRQQGVLL